jgi:WD40 repeat protein
VKDTKGEQPEQLGDLLKGHEDAITRIAFSPDGNVLASASGNEVVLWDVNVAGVRNRCELLDCPRTYEEVAQYLDKETFFQWLYRKTMKKPSLRELNK